MLPGKQASVSCFSKTPAFPKKIGDRALKNYDEW
jgi:hypothetical protein